MLNGFLPAPVSLNSLEERSPVRSIRRPVISLRCGSSGFRVPKKLNSHELNEIAQITNLPSGTIQDLYFRFIKISSDGRMNFSQFRSALGMVGLSADFLPKRMFAVFDRNQDGVLSYREYIENVAIMLTGSDEEKISLSFRMADVNGSGFIDREEFRELVKSYDSVMRSLVLGRQRDNLNIHSIDVLFDQMADKQVFRESVITYAGYKHAVETNPEFLRLLGLTCDEENAEELEERQNLEILKDEVYSIQQLLQPFLRLRKPPEWSFLCKTCVPQEEKKTELRFSPDEFQNSQRQDPLRMGGRQTLISSPDGHYLTPSLVASVPFVEVDSDANITLLQSRLESAYSLIDKMEKSRETKNSNKMRRNSLSSTAHNVHKLTNKSPFHRRHFFGERREAVHFGHDRWNTVVNIMIGIRIGVGRSQAEIDRREEYVDFTAKDTFAIVPKLSSLVTVEEQRQDVKTEFVDYAPVIFRKLRERFGIAHEAYVRSIGPEQLLGNMVLGNLSSLTELSSEGKSGALFFYTADGNFMLKAIQKREKKSLRKMLQSYYFHVINNPGTLLTRFFGLHGLVYSSTSFLKKHVDKQYFVVMGNMFNTPRHINVRYDLKGSWIGRSTPPEKQGGNVALKDVDFVQNGEFIELTKKDEKILSKSLLADVSFLIRHNVIDYSVLLGIHFVEKNDKESYGGWMSRDQKRVYYIGIIDILTEYTTKKIMEHTLKSVFNDSRGISCVHPRIYADRFLDFIHGHLK